MDKTQIKLLRDFVQVCKSKPEVIHAPELSFYKEYLLRWVLCDVGVPVFDHIVVAMWVRPEGVTNIRVRVGRRAHTFG